MALKREAKNQKNSNRLLTPVLLTPSAALPDSVEREGALSKHMAVAKRQVMREATWPFFRVMAHEQQSCTARFDDGVQQVMDASTLELREPLCRLVQ
jgi:hypothetical protein